MYINAQKPAAGKGNIMIISDYPTARDIRTNTPLSGTTGKLFTSLLHTAQVPIQDCYITHVINEAPSSGKLEEWCMSKREATAIWKEMGYQGTYPHKSVASGKYLHPNKLDNLARLRAEIIEQKPNIIIMLGNLPLWALTGEGGIMKERGSVMELNLTPTAAPFKAIATYHPSQVMAKWDMGLILRADLAKAARESKFPEVIRKQRFLYLEPSLQDIKDFKRNYLKDAPQFAWDIETIPTAEIITCIGFGTPTHAITIPFYDGRKGGNYWETAAEEAEAWRLIKSILQLPARKITQNGMYDMQWCWKSHGIYPLGDLHDTQLLHHSMYPEMKKDLGTLGSLYTNEISWKNLNPKYKTETKKDA